MTTLTSMLIFAKQGDPADVLIAFIIVVAAVVALIFTALQGPAHYHVTIKNGLPYCPRCNRQVSPRRDVCRACGFTIKTYGWAAPARAPTRDRDEELAERIDNLSDKIEQWGLRRAERRAERRAAREAYYREHGIEPGPWAWYRVLPEWQQAVLLGVAFAVPVVALLAILMR